MAKTKANLDRLADEMGIPRLDMSEDALAALMAVSAQVRAITGFIAHLNENNVYLAERRGTSMLLIIPSDRVKKMVLDHLGINEGDAQRLSDYVAQSVVALNNKGGE